MEMHELSVRLDSLMLGQLDLATTEGREGDVGDLHLACWGRHCEYGIRE